MAPPNRNAPSSCTALLMVLGWSSPAFASNASKPVVPASFPASECMTTLVRGSNDAPRFAIGIPFEDVGMTDDEVPGSRHMQFFATCHDRQVGRTLPTWISQADVDAAVLVDPTVVELSPDDILEQATAWNGPGHDGDDSACTWPIVSAEQRIAITCEATADGFGWDTTNVPVGAYVVWGYTYEGARSIWARRPGIVRVVDDDPDAAGPAVAFSSPAARGEMQLESGLLVEGCAAGAPGTTLTLSWASYADLVDDPEAPWVTFAELGAGAFSVEFVPPASALYAAVVFRARVIDPQGRSFTAISSDYVAVVPGCGAPTGGKAGVADACGVATPIDAPEPVAAIGCDDAQTESGDEGSSDGGELPAGDSSGGAPDPAADPAADPPTSAGPDGCACAGHHGPLHGMAAVLLVLSARRGRRRTT